MQDNSPTVRMNERTTRALSYGLWALCLIPAVVFAMWMGLVEVSWRGFAIAWLFYAVLLYSFEWLVRVIRRALERRSA